MTLQDQYVDDGRWMLNQCGETFTYIPKSGDSLITTGIIDRAAEVPPAWGYETTLSGRCHDITALTVSFPQVPTRGELIHFDGKDHKILNVSPVTDVVTLTVEY